MRKSRAMVLLPALCLLAAFAAHLPAQEWEDDWDFQMVDLYARGDQTFAISLGLIFPTVFAGPGVDPQFYGRFGLRRVGGSGSLAYTHFLGAHAFVGAEIGVKFCGTVGGNTLFIIPIGIRAGWQFIFRRFEFPVSVAAGIAPQRHMEDSHAGFFLRGGFSAFYRFSPEWSFGLNTDWSWYPQRPRVDGRRAPQYDVHGNIMGLTVSARYHF